MKTTYSVTNYDGSRAMPDQYYKLFVSIAEVFRDIAQRCMCLTGKNGVYKITITYQHEENSSRYTFQKYLAFSNALTVTTEIEVYTKETRVVNFILKDYLMPELCLQKVTNWAKETIGNDGYYEMYINYTLHQDCRETIEDIVLAGQETRIYLNFKQQSMEEKVQTAFISGGLAGVIDLLTKKGVKL